MSDFKKTVALTNVNSENMSRHEMLSWVNNMVNGKYKKIEELCSGVAYCQILKIIFPESINIKRVKMRATQEHEYIHNLKLFQDALTNLKFDKQVPIERLIKGRFQENLEFLQWFIKYVESQAPALEEVYNEATKPLSHTFQNTNKLRNETSNLRLIEKLAKAEIAKNKNVAICKHILALIPGSNGDVDESEDGDGGDLHY